MGVYSFIKEAGEKLFGIEKAEAEESHEISDDRLAKEHKEDIRAAQSLKERILEAGLAIKVLEVEIEGTAAILTGTADTMETREKVILIAGNSEGIEKVDENIKVENESKEAVFHTVEREDTLGSIAKAHYGDKEKVNIIFEANKPMLKDPDKIYPGQVLRIPQQ
ncbi:peptidoglycan-binding protein LysM [Zunongwangia sp. H14]|uniref:peptidoglycan-binding protein LysM n=1 Tax=Zunongwangia sp. H14 TaxID=3240792 RepID=UPI0035643AD6